MTFAIKAIGISILYLMIGVFLCTIAIKLDHLEYNDDYTILLILLWPLILALLILIAVVVLFPQWLAGVMVDAVKRWRK